MTFGAIVFKKTIRVANRKFTPLWLLVSGAALEACGGGGSTIDLSPSITAVDAALRTSSFDEGVSIGSTDLIFTVAATGPEDQVITFKIQSQTIVNLFAIDTTTGVITFVSDETFDYEQPDGIDFSSLSSTDERNEANTYYIDVVATANGLDSKAVTYTVTITDQPDAAGLATIFDIEPESNIVAPPTGVEDSLVIPVAEFLRAFVDDDTDPENQITHLSFDFAALPDGVTLQYDGVDIIDGVNVDISTRGDIIATIAAGTGADKIILSYKGIEGVGNPEIGGASLTFYVNNAHTISSVGTDVDGATVVDGNAIVIDENTGDDVVIFKIIFNDPDALDDTDGHYLTYSLKGVDADLFNVETDPDIANIAIISFRSGDSAASPAVVAFSPDFEALVAAGEGNLYDIKIVATDELGFSVSWELTVTINDQNEAPTNIVLSSNSIAEDQAVDAYRDPATPDVNYYFVGDITVTDPDAPDAPDEFNINPLVVRGTDSSDFEIVDGKLYLTTALDFETTPPLGYKIIIVANDGVTGLEFISDTITITVVDINEAPKLLRGPFEIGEVEKGSDAGAGTSVLISQLLASNRYSDEDADDTITKLEITGISAVDANGNTITLAGGNLTLTYTAQGSTTAVPLGIDTQIDLPSDASILGKINISIAATVADGTLFVITYKIYDSKGLASINADINADTIEFSAVTSLPIQFGDILDASDAIVIGNTVSVDEKSAANTIIAKVSATREDGLPSIVYSLAGGDSLFTIDSSGVITLASGDLNFEAEAGPHHYLTITATATASGSDPATDDPSANFILTVNVGDINEAPIGIEIQDENNVAITSIIENQPNEPSVVINSVDYYLVGTVAVTDPDAPDAFNINPLIVRGTDSSDFEIVDGKLYLTTVPDFETRPTLGYSISIVANESVTGLEFIAPIVITVDDADDLADVTVRYNVGSAEVPDLNTPLLIAENVDATTTLYTFTGTDQDADDQGVHETVKFRLAVEGSIFQITDAGVLTFSSSPDFEAEGAPSYDVVVIAYSVDGSSGVRIVDSDVPPITVKIVVIDVPEPAVVTVLDSNDVEVTDFNTQISRIAENVDATLYTFIGNDEDADETVKFELSATDGIFQIDTSTDATGVTRSFLTFVNPPDFETPLDADADAPGNNIYSVEVISYSEDSSNVRIPSSEVFRTVKIEVTDADDPAVVTVQYNFGGDEVTDFDTAPLLQIDENVDAGAALYTFTGRDDDAGEGVKFRLAVDDGLFIINDLGGLSYLSFANSPNFENPQDADDAPENNIYSVDVIAYSVDSNGDKVVDQIEVSTIVKIVVIDVNERPSIILPDGLYSIAGSFLIGDPDSTVILTITADDPDADDILTYSIASQVIKDGADVTVFEIDPNTGDLSFTSAAVAADAGEYEVTITVTDADDLTDTISVAVSAVTEVAKHQVLFAPGATDSSISFSDLVGFAAVTGANAAYIIFTDWDMTQVTLSDLSGQIIRSGIPIEIPADVDVDADVDYVLQIANTFSSYKKDSLIRYFVNYDNFSSKAVILGIDIDGTQPEITVDNSGFGDLVQYVTTPPTDDVTLASYSATDDDLDPDITYKLYYQTGSGDYVEILSTDSLFGFETGDTADTSDVVLKSGANLDLNDPNLIENSQGSYLKIVVAAFDSVTVDYEISEISDISIASFDVYLARFDPYFEDTEISLNENTVLALQLEAKPIAASGATITYSKITGLQDDGDLFSLTSGGFLTFAVADFAPDFENPQDAGADHQYTLTVIASYDNQGTPLTREQELTINIIDVNEVPEFASSGETSFTIDTVIPGTISIGDLISLFVDQDQDIVRVNFKPLINIGLEYKGKLIVEGTADDERYFVIDDSVIDINVRNFGLVAGTTATFSYTVEDSAGGESATADLTFTNIAGSELEISLGDDILPTAGDQLGDFYYQISISEHYANGNPPVFTSVYRFGDAVDILATVLATDDDGVTPIEYSILLQFDTFTDWDVDIFVIDSISGKLTIKDDVFLSNDPDSQVGKEYSVIIIATSGDDSEPLELLVSIEYLPEFVADVESVVIALSAFDDETTTLFELASTTRNASVDSTYTVYEYSILSQKDGSGTELVVALFEMEATNYLGGKVTLIADKSLAYTASLDYDANGENTYTITVVASGWDTSVGATSGWDGDTLELTLTVREELEINADVTNPHYEKELGDAKVGHKYTLVDTYTLADSDTLTGSDLFSVATKSGKTVLIYNIDNIDNLPATGTYQLTLEERVDGVDGVDGDLVETLLFTASIVSVGASANYADGDILSITEGTSVAVGDITIQTPDGTDIDETAEAVEYYFIGDGDGDRKFFDIVSDTGEITFKTAPDYENPFKTFVLEVGETSAEALVRLNTYNITVGAKPSGDNPLYGSVVVRDLVVKVTDDSTDGAFLLQDRGSSGEVTVSYKSDASVESEITVSGIAGTHTDAQNDLQKYYFIPAGTIILPILGSGVFGLTAVSDITVDPLSTVAVIHPFEIIDGNLVIKNVDPTLNYGDTTPEGGVKIDAIKQVYKVTIGDGSNIYTFNIKLSPFNLVEYYDTDTITDISIFENLGTDTDTPGGLLYKVPNRPNLYQVPSVDRTLTPDDIHPGLLYLGDVIPIRQATELLMLAPVDLTDYDPPAGGSDFFDFNITWTLIKDGDLRSDPDTIFEEVTKSLRIEIKDAPIVKPQNLDDLDLGLGESSTTPLNLPDVFPLALLEVDGYAEYTVTYAIADDTPQNLQDIFTITGTEMDQLSMDQLSIYPNFDFDYETTLIPLIHRGELIGYSDGYLKHINTVNITLDLAGTLVGPTGDDINGAETAKTNLRIHLGDDTDEIVFVSPSSATIYADTENEAFYVPLATKKSDNSNFNYTISDVGTSSKFDIGLGYGHISVKEGFTIVTGDTFTVTATYYDDSSLTQDFTVTVSVNPDDHPAATNNAVANYFIHQGYTDIYAVENEAANSLLYKIYTDDSLYNYLDSYTLTGDDARFFAISGDGELTFKSGLDSETGELTFKPVLDYENPADTGADNIYAVTINARVKDHDSTFDYSQKPINLNIHIVDVDDAPVLDEAKFLFVIGSDDYSSPFGVFTAIDPDATGDVITYSITGDDALLLFDISATGELTFKTQPVVDELIFKAQPVAGELAGQVIASSTGSSEIEQSDIIDFTVKVILSTGSDAGGTSSFEASDIDGDIIEFIPVDYWAS